MSTESAETVLGARYGSRTFSARDTLIVFSVVLAVCLFGIATRPAGLLAAIWPANALLLGLFVRHPRLATPAGWTAAVAAYLAADLATGAALPKTLLLTFGNLAGVVVGYLLYMRLEVHDRCLKRPFSVLYLALIAAAASAASGFVGSVANPVLFDGGAVEGWFFWFTTEFVNFIIILPVVLTFPVFKKPLVEVGKDILDGVSLANTAPILALIVSCAASWWIGGPGVFAFPVPALLWCALVYCVPITAIITFLFSAWTLVAIAKGIVFVGADFNSISSLLSIRMGVALIALAPINVASVMAARNEFQLLLQSMVTNDPLTATLNRRAFILRCRNVLAAEQGKAQTPIAMLLCDVDKLQTINAGHGHDAGDEVLRTFARIARSGLPNAENIGRLGSDEFGILLVGCSGERAAAMAERLRAVFAEKSALWGEACQPKPTVSIGIALTYRPPASIEPLIAQADHALARAKASGGNAFAFAEERRA